MLNSFIDRSTGVYRDNVDIRHAEVSKGRRIHDGFCASQILANMLEVGVSNTTGQWMLNKNVLRHIS